MNINNSLFLDKSLIDLKFYNKLLLLLLYVGRAVFILLYRNVVKTREFNRIIK